MDYSEEDDPLLLKADNILAQMELILGSKEGLSPIQRSIIDRCTRIIYQKWQQNPIPENIPILEDMYNALLSQKNEDAQELADALEIYVYGSLSFFNHRTNVEINNRLVSFNTKELGKSLKKYAMLIIEDQIWNKVSTNKNHKKWTWVYLDEFHLYLKDEQTATFSVDIWKRFRKWGGIPTGITQNVKDLLSSNEVENIFENTQFYYLLSQGAGDREILANKLGISPLQLSYINNKGEGTGLVVYENIILPFVDRFPHDTKLYEIMTTKMYENIESEDISV